MDYYRLVFPPCKFNEGLNFLIKNKCIVCHTQYGTKYNTIPFRTETLRKDLLVDLPEGLKMIKYRKIPECFKKNMFNK